MSTEIDSLELLHFGAEAPTGHIGGIMQGLKPEVISAGSTAVKGEEQHGYHAGITALGAIPHIGLGPHMHTRLQMRAESLGPVPLCLPSTGPGSTRPCPLSPATRGAGACPSAGPCRL